MKFDKIKDLLIVVLLIVMVITVKWLDKDTNNIFHTKHDVMEENMLEEEAWFWGVHI